MLKNYTSSVAVSRSVQHIEDKLVSCGARNILKDYDEKGRISGILFIIEINGRKTPFKLPAKVENVERNLRSMRKKPPKTSQLQEIRLQAERTAWKIISDWVDIQMSLIELDQAEFMEIFLPYAYDGMSKQTYFQMVKENNFKLLPETT